MGQPSSNLPPSSVKQLIKQWEAAASTPPPKVEGKTSNGHSVHSHSTTTGEKTGEVAKETIPTQEKGSPPSDYQATWAKIRQGKVPPPPSEGLESSKQTTPWTKTGRSNEAQTPLAAQHRNTGDVSAQVGSLWQQSHASVKKPLQPPEAKPTPVDPEKQKQMEQLKNQLDRFSAATKLLQINPKRKIVVGKDGMFDIAKRRFGITWGRSEGTKEMIASLKQMETTARSSNSPELLSQYITTLKDLRATTWGKKIERNSEIKNEFNRLSASINDSFKANTQPRISSAINVAVTSTNRTELTNAIKALTATRNLPQLTTEQKAEIDAALSTATTSLNRIPPENMAAMLIGQDTHTEGRDLMLASAGVLIKAEKFVQPLQEALGQVKLLYANEETKGEAIKAMQSLTQAAIKLATLPDAKLDAQSDDTSLRDVLSEIRNSSMLDENPKIRQNAQALNILLTYDRKSISNLEPLKQALKDQNKPQAFAETVLLAFLSHGELERPIDPSNPDSRTVRQEMMTVRNWANQQLEYQDTVAVFDLLMAANAERIDNTPLVSTLAPNAYKMEETLQNIGSGVSPSERKELVRALRDDMRNQFGSAIKATGTKEFEGLAWSKADKSGAPKLVEGFAIFNKTSETISTSIVNAKSQAEAQNLINFYIDLLDSCIEDKNYGAAMAIFAAFNNSAIARIPTVKAMHDYAAANPESQKNGIERATRILSNQGSYKILREEMETATKAHEKPIPYTGVLLTDLTFMTDGNPDTIDGKINLDKTKLLSKVVTKFVQSRDALVISPQRKTDFFEQTPLGEEEIYKKSLALFPRKGS